MAFVHIGGDITPVDYHADVRERREESRKLFVLDYAVRLDLGQLGEEVVVCFGVEEARWWESHGCVVEFLEAHDLEADIDSSEKVENALHILIIGWRERRLR